MESLKTSVDDDIDLLERASKKNNDVELWEDEVLTVKLLLWSVQLLLLLLVQFLVLRLFGKICHQHLHPLNHLLVKVVIKRREDKLLERKWRKCWTIAEIKKNSKRSPKDPNQYKFRGRKNSAKFTKEDREIE